MSYFCTNPGPSSFTLTFGRTFSRFAIVALGPPDASTSAEGAALDEPILTDIESGADQLLSTAFPDGLSDPFSLAQGGWMIGPLEVDPYTNVAAASGIFNPFVGQDVDPFTNMPADGANPNAFTGGQNVNPFTDFQGAVPTGASPTDTSQWLASNGPIPASTGTTQTVADSESVAQIEPDKTHELTPEELAALLASWSQPDEIEKEYHLAAPQWNASASAPTPNPITPPSNQPQAQQPGQVDPPIPSPTPDLVSTPSSWSTMIGDLLAGIAGLFGPNIVGPYLHPQTPANLPMGLQQMGQLNASAAQQSMQATGAAVRSAMVAAGAPYVVTMGALAGPAVGGAVGRLSFEASIQVASRFPVVGAGGAAAGSLVAAEKVGEETLSLGPTLENSLPSLENNASALGTELQTSISTVELNERFAMTVSEQNQILASDLPTAGYTPTNMVSGIYGNIGWVASDPRLASAAAQGSQGITMAQAQLNRNPQLIPNLVDFWRAGLNPKFIPSVYGKGLEALSGQGRYIPNMVQYLGGKYQPDYILSVGGVLIPADLTTIEALAEHLERPYYQEDFIIWLHQGPPLGWPWIP